MNDRYLYRAKRTDNGEWVIGNLLLDTEKEKPFETFRIYPVDYVVLCRIVNPSTICQCTGLKDKNGKLIWENDIVKVRYSDGQEEISQVSWDKYGYYPWTNEYQCDGCVLYCEITDIEVIGNIFDNPELLEVEE